jgi:cell division protein FtsX
MTTIAFITTAILAFAVGVGVGVYFTCKAIASGKVKNVTVTV